MIALAIDQDPPKIDPAQVIALDTAYLCANCNSILTRESLSLQKGVLGCPSCCSAQVYPMSRWFT